MNRIATAALLLIAVACIVAGTVVGMHAMAFDWPPPAAPSRPVVVALP